MARAMRTVTVYLARQTGATVFSLSTHCFVWLKSQNYNTPITHITHTHTHNHLTALVRDYLGRPIPEETLTHSHPS